MEKAVVTIVIGKKYKEIAKLSHPSIKSYADKIGAEFVVLEENSAFPHWQKFRLYKLLAKYKRIIFLDSDLIVRPDCPDLFEIVPEKEIGLFEEGKFSPREGYMLSAMEVYNIPFPEWKRNYYNTGVMVVSRYHRQFFNYKPSLEIMTAGQFLGEQTYLNIQLQINDAPIFDLQYYFNRMTLMDTLTGEPRFASYIIHYAGCPTFEMICQHMKEDLARWKEDYPSYEYRRNIVISVGGGLGDQICGEPIARYIIEKLYPNANICILSHWPRLFEHLGVDIYPHDHIFNDEGPYHVRNTLPDQDTPLWRHITNPLCHTVDFGSISACGRMIPDIDKKIKLKTSKKGREEVADLIDIDTIKDLVLIHPGKGWESKTFPFKWWQSITDGLISNGVKVGIIGKRMNKEQGYVPIICPEGAFDFRDLLSLDGLISLISEAKILISNDSAPIHIAGAFDNWIVLIATCKHPDHVLPYRGNGYKYHKALALYKELTVNTINSTPTMNTVGGQTLDYVVGDIYDYLPDIKEVIKKVVEINNGLC